MEIDQSNQPGERKKSERRLAPPGRRRRPVPLSSPLKKKTMKINEDMLNRIETNPVPLTRGFGVVDNNTWVFCRRGGSKPCNIDHVRKRRQEHLSGKGLSDFNYNEGMAQTSSSSIGRPKDGMVLRPAEALFQDMMLTLRTPYFSLPAFCYDPREDNISNWAN